MKVITTVPYLDVAAAYQSDRHEINAAIARVLSSGSFVLDSEVSAFEIEFSKWLGVKHTIGCASGTEALALTLRALSIGPGSTVVTTSYGSVAVVAAIESVGAEALLIDIEPGTFNIDVSELSELLSQTTPRSGPIRAVIVVHLCGNPADLPSIVSLAEYHGIAVIEDCSQAHGAELNGRMVGTAATAAIFSFYPTKNLGALGDAGAVVTDKHYLAERLWQLRQYGWNEERVCQFPGVNGRMDELQAAILRVRLPKLATTNARRRYIAATYCRTIANTLVRAPRVNPNSVHVFHRFVVLTTEREAFRNFLLTHDVDARVHYARPIHLEPAYFGRLKLGPSACRVSETVSEQALGLPIFPDMVDEQVNWVTSVLEKAIRSGVGDTLVKQAGVHNDQR